jgi:hypothetical protein
MLYMHCGWPRTGTSSLQNALYRHRDDLAAAHILYPERWLWNVRPAHHGLYRLLDTSSESAAHGAEDFKGFLVDQSDRHVLLSAEGLTPALLSQGQLEAFLALLAAAREVTPTRCIWTLRRFDEAIESLYLFRLIHGPPVPAPGEYFSGMLQADSLFDGMRRAKDIVNGNVACVRYKASGAHNGELLSAFDVPAPVKAIVLDELHDGRRLNVSIGYKQAVVLVKLDELSTRLGIDLDRERLREAFRSGEFAFEKDSHCEPMDIGMKQALHEQALSAACSSGFPAYAEWFSDAEISGPSSAVWDLDVLTERDLTQLASYLSSKSVKQTSSTST